MANKTALLAGASGLVGGELLKCLLSGPEYAKVIILVRKPLGINHPKLEERVVDFDQLASYQESFQVNDVFCCLGTTIKRAGSQVQFKKVDVDYPLEMARLAKDMGAEKFLVISSMGADPKSVVFYSRMKGLLEEQLKAIGIKSLHIFRPSLLLGDRQEFRFGESIAAALSKGLGFLFVGVLQKYKPITASKVAKGMYQAAQGNAQDIYTYLSQHIAKM